MGPEANTKEPLAPFKALNINIDQFTHREHLRAAWLILDRYEFVEAMVRYIDGIRALASAHGASDKFNLTLTLAWLGIIAERKAQSEATNFDQYLHENADLLEASLMSKWYSKKRLFSPQAKRSLLLPDRS